MNEVRSIVRSARKIDELIVFALDYHNLKYLKKIKHTGNNKLNVYKNLNDDIVIQYKVPLFCFSKYPSFVSKDNKRKITINEQKFDVQVYDKSEIFNLSTIHEINLLGWLQAFCLSAQSKSRTIQVFQNITQDLLYDAHSAISTQYEKIDEDKYTIYRGR